jgi:hypothetical protein
MQMEMQIGGRIWATNGFTAQDAQHRACAARRLRAGGRVNRGRRAYDGARSSFGRGITYGCELTWKRGLADGVSHLRARAHRWREAHWGLGPPMARGSLGLGPPMARAHWGAGPPMA